MSTGFNRLRILSSGGVCAHDSVHSRFIKGLEILHEQNDYQFFQNYSAEHS
jgi:hypothetical protein